jgi:hypothetical protein
LACHGHLYQLQVNIEYYAELWLQFMVSDDVNAPGNYMFGDPFK